MFFVFRKLEELKKKTEEETESLNGKIEVSKTFCQDSTFLFCHVTYADWHIWLDIVLYMTYLVWSLYGRTLYEDCNLYVQARI